MQTVIVNTPFTTSVTFEVDGVATDPSPATATVTITRDNGTAIVTNVAATRTGVGVFAYPLTVAQNSLMDVLTARWTSSLGVLETTTEVAGGFMFTIAQARALPPLNSTQTYSTQQIVDARTMAENAIEDACGVALVPRYFSHSTYSASTRPSLLLKPRLRSLRSVTADGVAVSIATAVTTPEGSAELTDTSWPAGNLAITGEHGYDACPPRVARAALLLAKRFLVASPVSDRSMAHTNDDGSTDIFVTAGRGGAPTDVPEANAVIALYGVRAGLCVA